MLTLESSSGIAWLKQRRLTLVSRKVLAFESGSPKRIEIAMPLRALEILALSYTICTGFDCGLPSLTKGLIWIEEKDIWNPDFEAIGDQYLRLLLTSYSGTTISDFQNVFCVLDRESLTEQEALISIPLIFQWDAFVVPDDGSYFCFICHDGFLRFETSVEARYRELLAALQPWEPRTSDGV